MNVIIEIDGREAIPVRAIPFVTGWSLDPQELINNFSKVSFLTRLDVVAYSFNDNRTISKILPKEWDGVAVNLKALVSVLKKKNEVDDEGYAEWRRESIAFLPPGCFVWKDEFSEGHKRNLGIGLNERVGDREDNFSPLIPVELKDKIFEGFEAYPFKQGQTEKNEDSKPNSELDKPLSQRERTSLYRIIASMGQTLLEAGKPDFDMNNLKNQASLINYLATQYDGYEGVSKSNLEKILPIANNVLKP